MKHVTTMELDGEVGKITLPASSGMAQPQPQGASDRYHLDNRATTSTASTAVHAVPPHLAPNAGQVFHGEGRVQTDFERMIDSEQLGYASGDIRRSLSLGYATGSHLTPLTVERPGRGKEQQFVSTFV